MSDKPTHYKRTILNGIGMILATLGTGVIAHVVEVGSWMQKHPSLTTGFAAGAGAILYGWASWTHLLLKRDSKRERIADALRKGRLVCHCNDEGEIMKQHHNLPRFENDNLDIEVYSCPECAHYEVVDPNDGILICESIEWKPKMPATARMKWLEDCNNQR